MLTISLHLPPVSVQKERRGTSRRPLRELNMCPLSCAVGSGGGHSGRAWGDETGWVRASAAKWRKTSIMLGLACTPRVCWASNVCMLPMDQIQAVWGKIHWWGLEEVGWQL